MHLLRRLLLLSCALPGTAFALTLGEPAGQAVIGRPLAISVRLSGADASRVSADCARILPGAFESSDAGLKSAVVRIENGSAIITTRQAVYDPVLSFRLRIECGFQFEREYVLLPSPPESVVPATAPTQTQLLLPAEPVIPATAVKQTPLILEAISTAPAQPPAGSGYVVPEQTTLRLMSRKRYPLDSRARVTFIHRVAAANPEKFDDVQAAFDKPLAAGVQLRLPANLPQQRSTSAPPSPKPVVKLATRERVASGGKGRLIIGSDMPSDKTVTELKSDIDRLVKAMSAQVETQDAMTQHLKVLTEEVAQAKQAMSLLNSVNQRLESDVRDLRGEEKRNSYIQLVLAILLGGFAVASFLLWRTRERRPNTPPSYPHF